MGRPKRDRGDLMNARRRANLIAFRKALGLSQEDAATLAGVSVQNILNYEQGKRSPTNLTILAPLLRVYGHTADDLDSAKPGPPRAELMRAFELKVNPIAGASKQLIDETRALVEKQNEKHSKAFAALNPVQAPRK